MSRAIEYRDIKKIYGDRAIIEGFSIGIEQGEFVTIIGSSGCGKTTILKMVNGLVEPSGGTVIVNGRDIRNENMIELRRNMGYVIQQTGLFVHMTVRENIEIVPQSGQAAAG